MSQEILRDLENDRLSAIEKQQNLLNAANNGNLTESQFEQLDVLNEKVESLNKAITTMERVHENRAAAGRSRGRQTEPDPTQGGFGRPYNSAARVQAPNNATFGHYCVAAARDATAKAKGGMVSRENQEILNYFVKNAATSYGSEGIGPDGGFDVAPDFKTDIWQKVGGEESLLGRCDQLPTQSNQVVLPKDETTDWDTSGGIQAHWEGEASQLTQSKPLLENTTLRTNKLTALIPVTDELLEDAPTLEKYLRRKVATKFDFKFQDALINGSGVGQPLGILNSDCLISVAKGSAQAADSLLYENIVSMWSRMYAPCRKNAVWHINQDVEQQLLSMFLEGESSSIPVYTPGKPYGSLLGCPVIPLQSCQTVGDKGDILLCDWSQYLAIIKGQMRSDVSIHLFFDYGITSFRFVLRMTGQPWWRTYISPANGSNTLSCFVSLDERAG